jgi:hypothetical protein
MPAPPKAVATSEPDVGAVALERYAMARVEPHVTGGAAYAYGFAGYGGYGYGGYGCWPYGGYRIALSPWTYYGWRGWNGGYVYPPWLCHSGSGSFGFAHWGIQLPH